MWSCGVMLFVMLYGKYPFEDMREAVLPDVHIPDRCLQAVGHHVQMQGPPPKAAYDIALSVWQSPSWS